MNKVPFKMIVKELFKNKKTRFMIIGGILSTLAVAGDVLGVVASMYPDPPQFGSTSEVTNNVNSNITQ